MTVDRAQLNEAIEAYALSVQQGSLADRQQDSAALNGMLNVLFRTLREDKAIIERQAAALRDFWVYIEGAPIKEFDSPHQETERRPA